MNVAVWLSLVEFESFNACDHDHTPPVTTRRLNTLPTEWTYRLYLHTVAVCRRHGLGALNPKTVV